jgi:predicted RNase H-like nuclease (RuvC/YqgF family)
MSPYELSTMFLWIFCIVVFVLVIRWSYAVGARLEQVLSRFDSERRESDELLSRRIEGFERQGREQNRRIDNTSSKISGISQSMENRIDVLDQTVKDLERRLRNLEPPLMPREEEVRDEAESPILRELRESLARLKPSPKDPVDYEVE